jgi:hypothetical protein
MATRRPKNRIDGAAQHTSPQQALKECADRLERVSTFARVEVREPDPQTMIMRIPKESASLLGLKK